MTENTDYPTGALGDPADTREPADYDDPAAYLADRDPDADPEMLNPRDTLGDDPVVEGYEPEGVDGAAVDPDADPDSDPDALDPRDVR